MDQLAFVSSLHHQGRIIKTHVLVGPDLTTLAVETEDRTIVTLLSREQMLDLHAALARQLGFTD